MATREERARTLAHRMPLVNFPARRPFTEWLSWGRLQSEAMREGDPDAFEEPTSFPQLRRRHVFAYAGPSCFFHDGALGDAAMYFRPGSEQRSTGSATPFDTGSLEDPNPHLQPWASQPIEDRWRFCCSQRVRVTEFRASFEGWLARSYDDPDRYLECRPTREAAGKPDRLEPPEILEHNGPSGREKYEQESPSKRCADRRAWTWEVQVRGEITFENVVALHVPPHLEVLALDTVDAWDATYGGVKPVVKILPSDLPAGPDSIYLDSGRVLRDLIEGS